MYADGKSYLELPVGRKSEHLRSAVNSLIS